MSLDSISGIQSVSAIRAVQPYTSVLYGVAPSEGAVKAGVKASQQDARDTQAKLAAQQAATDDTPDDTGQGTRVRSRP